MGLSAQNLSIGYPPNKVLLEGADLELNSGDLVGLVGQNGVGKSTLLRTLCGLIPALGGSLRLNSSPIESYKQTEIAQQVSVVLTGWPGPLNLTVYDLIALGRYPHTGWLGSLKDHDRKQVDAALTQMQINYIADKKLQELSDGQLQKAMIARALAQDTDLIILDEPTSHLDLKNKVEVLSLLRDVARKGKGVLISTHEIQLSSEVCDLYWCMDFGKPLLMGKPQSLIKEGQVHEYLHLPEEIKL